MPECPYVNLVPCQTRQPEGTPQPVPMPGPQRDLVLTGLSLENALPAQATAGPSQAPSCLLTPQRRVHSLDNLSEASPAAVVF